MTSPRPLVLFTPAGPLAAHVHREPADFVTRQPTVLITGSWLTVKEQMADRYAAALARRGYTAVTFDFSGFGASRGDPRQAELPNRKAAEITAAAHAVSALSFVRPGALGYLGVCASAQYALRAVADGAPIAALAAVAGWFHDAPTIAPVYGGVDGIALRLDRAREALDAYTATCEVRTVPAYAPGNDRAGMPTELDYYAAQNRGAIPAWRNEMAELSWLYWLTFDGLSAADRTTTPTLFVHSDDCVLPDNARHVAERIRDAELVWTEGTQTDFYDRDDRVELAVEAADRHFRRHLPG